MKENEESFFTNICWAHRAPYPLIETWHPVEKRRLMLTGDMIFAQPPHWRSKYIRYPIFHEYWKREDEGGGALWFFHVELSLHDHAYYEAPEFRAVKDGAPDMCVKLPDSLAGLSEVFGRRISWTIDFEAKAREILEKSQLREFASACKKLRVIN